MIPSDFYSFHLISFTRISRGPCHHKSASLNNKYEYHSASQRFPKAQQKIPCQCIRTPSVTSSEPLPKRSENPSGATAVHVGRVHRGPRRHQRLDLSCTAFPRRRGCDAEGGAAATAVEKQSVENWMFLRVVGKKKVG